MSSARRQQKYYACYQQQCIILLPTEIGNSSSTLVCCRGFFIEKKIHPSPKHSRSSRSVIAEKTMYKPPSSDTLLSNKFRQHHGIGLAPARNQGTSRVASTRFARNPQIFSLKRKGGLTKAVHLAFQYFLRTKIVVPLHKTRPLVVHNNIAWSWSRVPRHPQVSLRIQTNCSVCL